MRANIMDGPNRTTMKENGVVPPHLPARSVVWIVAASSFAFAVIQLDVTIVNVALSRISADFGATVAELQSVIDGYTLGFAALLLSAGVVVDRLGSKRVFVTGFFLVNIPICAFGLALTLRCVPPTQRDKGNQRSFDLAGQALAILTRPDRSAAQLASQRLVLW